MARILQIISKFLASRMLSVLLIIGMAGAGLYIVNTIKQNAVLENKLDQANANTEKLNRRLTAEMAISKHKKTLEDGINNAEKHGGCPNPRILRDTLERLHVSDGQ